MQHLHFSSQKAPISGRLNLRFICKEDLCESNGELELFKTNADNQDQSTHEASEHDIEDAEEYDNAETCTFEEDSLHCCALEEIETNSRFRLLHSRYLKNDERTRDLCFVPALENELEFDWNAENSNVLETGNWMNPIDLYKHEGKKYIKSLYQAIRSQCCRLQHVMETKENLLIGDEPASWRYFQIISIILNVNSIFILKLYLQHVL